MSDSLRRPPASTPATISQRVEALPHINSEGGAVEERVAIAAFFELAVLQPSASQHIREHFDKLLQHALNELEQFPGKDEHYIVTIDELRGIIARAAIVGGGQFAYDLGGAAKEVQGLMTAYSTPDQPPQSAGETV